MSWNLRVLKSSDEFGDIYSVHEVYYDDDGNVDSWTALPPRVSEDSVEDLKGRLDKLALALEKPVLEEVGETLVEVGVY